MSRVVRMLVAVVVALGAVAGLGACSSHATGVPAGAVVVDVRTPAEYAAGHLSGAVNLDVESATFAAQVGRLDTKGQYLLYCRSGSRAGQAASRMSSMGFAHVTNLGSIGAAATTTGLAVVTH